MANDKRRGDAPNVYPLGHPRNVRTATAPVRRRPQPHTAGTRVGGTTARPAPVDETAATDMPPADEVNEEADSAGSSSQEE